MTYREEIIGDARLILGDCRDILPVVSAIDVTITDPPYGIAGGWGSGLRKGGGRAKSRGAKGDYGSAAFSDTPAYVRDVIAPMVVTCVNQWGRAAVTPGLRNMRAYPAPAHIGSFQYPGSTVMSCWGPVLWQPILYYGRDPHQGRLVPDSRPNCNDVDLDTPHPCPKPLKQWSWLVQRASRVGETVFDPFMGSGTTGVACLRLGRQFIGCEIAPQHFETACRRIEEAYRQPRLFEEPPPKPVQGSLLDGEAA
jgi:site-specific DNA-methyltransferase (adenine-specific)